MKLILVLAILLVISSPAVAQNKQVRDANGRLVETWSQQGNNTDVRDANGRLKERRTIRGNTVEVRDANGRLLRSEKLGN